MKRKIDGKIIYRKISQNRFVVVYQDYKIVYYLGMSRSISATVYHKGKIVMGINSTKEIVNTAAEIMNYIFSSIEKRNENN